MNDFNVYAQLQVPGGSFNSASVTLTIGGKTVLIPVSRERLKAIQSLLQLPEEG